MTDSEKHRNEAALLREYVQGGQLMQIATLASDGGPRVSHCWYAADRELNLVFLSRVGRHHSREILTDKRVAGGIIATPLEGLGQKVRGATFQGTAHQIVPNDLTDAYETYCLRWPQAREMVSLEALTTEATENRLWTVIPTTYVLFDEISFPDEPRRELVAW